LFEETVDDVLYCSKQSVLRITYVVTDTQLRRHVFVCCYSFSLYLATASIWTPTKNVLVLQIAL